MTCNCARGRPRGLRWQHAGVVEVARVVDGLFFPGYGPADAAPDLGDSAITETAGVGGFAMAAAPAIVQFVGGTPQDAIANTNEMTHITLGRNGALLLFQEILHRLTEAGIHDEMRGLGDRRLVTARKLVLALGSGLDVAKPVRDRPFDRLVIAELEMEELHLLDRAPVAAVQSILANQV